MNTFGEYLRLTTFGESHGPAVGGVIDGYPAGVKVDYRLLKRRLEERRPGQKGSSQRRENDMPEFLSGINNDGVTLGTPIAFIVKNADIRSSDYDNLAHVYRPNHADYTYQAKYGIRDHRGGGRASARETVSRVVAGTFAEQLLLEREITVRCKLISVGEKKGDVKTLLAEIERIRSEGDSAGGVVECVIEGLEAGVGNPVYDKLSARLAYAMMGINAAKGFEIGDGFELATRQGSDVIDAFYKTSDGKIKTRSNHSGGIQGGISNGMPVVFRVAFKPTPTIGKPLPVMNEEGEESVITISGRHDPCVALRAVPVVRAMACLAVSDLILLSRS